MPPKPAGGRGPALEAKSLGYRFADGSWAFRGVDVELREGEISMLAGRNGAGKTLLAKHLAGLMPPTEGEVLSRGVELRSISGGPARAVGYVFQDARLQAVGETVEDDVLFGPANLGLGKAQARSRADEAIAACGLGDLRRSFVHTLSGGEQRLLAIAGVLAMRPAAAILDEPFANLDRDGVSAVLRVAKAMAEGGMAVLVITHEIEKSLGLASEFMVMDGGRIALSGDPAAVLAAGVESYGLRDPFRAPRSIGDLSWLS
jgi:energy-coupling factor transporter ATP-binding protein EcfA2